jgi:Ca-activated chloride channel family protein
VNALALGVTLFWAGLWFTPDQQGQQLFARGAFAESAEVFHDPLWQGAAYYRNGDYLKAAQAFARRDSAEAHYNQGNARLMLGAYDAAIACYDRALARHPDWRQALQNRAIALARAQRVAQKGGDLGDQRIGADEIVFDKDQPNEGHDTELDGGKTLSDQEIQALWLRRVQTRPADFLRAKFAWQQALSAAGAQP